MKDKLNIYACSGVDSIKYETGGSIPSAIVNKNPVVNNSSIDEPVVNRTDEKVPIVNTNSNIVDNLDVRVPVEDKYFEISTKDELWISTEVKNDITDSGWEQNKTLMKYLGSSKEDGCAAYFLYLFIPDDQLYDYSAAVIRKRELQAKTYDYVLSVWTELQYGTEEELQEVIKNGIEDTFDAPIDNVLYEIKTGNREGIGLATEAIIAIISAIVAILTAIISGVIEYCKTKAAAKYTAPSYSELKASVPESTDIIGNSKSTSNTWLWLAAGVGVVLMLFGKRNK